MAPQAWKRSASWRHASTTRDPGGSRSSEGARGAWPGGRGRCGAVLGAVWWAAESSKTRSIRAGSEAGEAGGWRPARGAGTRGWRAARPSVRGPRCRARVRGDLVLEDEEVVLPPAAQQQVPLPAEQPEVRAAGGAAWCREGAGDCPEGRWARERAREAHNYMPPEALERACQSGAGMRERRGGCAAGAAAVRRTIDFRIGRRRSKERAGRNWMAAPAPPPGRRCHTTSPQGPAEKSAPALARIPAGDYERPGGLGTGGPVDACWTRASSRWTGMHYWQRDPTCA